MCVPVIADRARDFSRMYSGSGKSVASSPVFCADRRLGGGGPERRPHQFRQPFPDRRAVHEVDSG